MLHYVHQLVSDFVMALDAGRVGVYTGFIRAFISEHLPAEPKTRRLITVREALKTLKLQAIKRKQRAQLNIILILSPLCFVISFFHFYQKDCIKNVLHYCITIIWPFSLCSHDRSSAVNQSVVCWIFWGKSYFLKHNYIRCKSPTHKYSKEPNLLHFRTNYKA